MKTPVGISLMALVSVAGLSGCGTLTTNHVMTGPAGPPRSGDVQIVIEGAPEPRGLQEVAIVQSVGTGSHATLEELVEGLKEEARTLGCEVVVHVHVDQGSSNAAASGVAARFAMASPLPPPPPATVRATASSESAGLNTCDPPCSAGYACNLTACVQLCSPPCGPGQTCRPDRTCAPQ